MANRSRDADRNRTVDTRFSLFSAASFIRTIIAVSYYQNDFLVYGKFSLESCSKFNAIAYSELYF